MHGSVLVEATSLAVKLPSPMAGFCRGSRLVAELDSPPAPSAARWRFPYGVCRLVMTNIFHLPFDAVDPSSEEGTS
jgi:hypothetical protein